LVTINLELQYKQTHIHELCTRGSAKTRSERAPEYEERGGRENSGKCTR
jgi:hypothetical protein